MATVHVGADNDQKTFLVHRSLLSQASQYFDRALNGHFLESGGTLKLDHHTPLAFEVLYQYLYSGHLLQPGEIKLDGKVATPYTYEVRERLFWVHVVKLADETMISELKEAAYESLIKLFARDMSKQPRPATRWILRELFDPERPLPQLQELFAAVAAYGIHSHTLRNSSRWQEDWACYPQYALMVLNRVAVLSETRTCEYTLHPCQDPEFSLENVFAPTCSKITSDSGEIGNGDEKLQNL